MGKDKDVSKMYADKLGEREKQKGTRGWDGKSLDDRDARFYGLRESGYSGWIDQNGYMK
jgi:hypothetical protein